MKPIPSFPGYFADESGSIWTIKRKGGNDRAAGKTGTPRRLSFHRIKGGYCRVNLDLQGKTVARLVHHLVLETFVGPRPEGKEGCHYPDENKENNSLANLRWDTRLENVKDKTRDRPIATIKECRKCKMEKPVGEFYKDNRASDGLGGHCKKCHCALAMATRDPEKRRKANREYMQRRYAALKAQ